VVERDGIPFARIDTPGAVFGEMAAVLGQTATATARVSEISTFRVADDPIAFLSDRPGAALEVLRLAATRLDGLTRYLSDVKRQYADLAGHLGMVDDVLNVLVHHQPRPVRPGSAREPDPDY
jgi:CRP-like cAMP-binding protein